MNPGDFKVELFASSAFAPCLEALRVWSAVAAEYGVAFEAIDINSPAGQMRARILGVAVVPLVAVNGSPLALGVQTPDEARECLRGVLEAPDHAAMAAGGIPVSK